MPLHIGKGRDVSTAISDIIDYVENPQKTDNGRLIYGYECDTRTADAEFLLSKRQYINLTGRQRGTDDVIAYHLRQSFMPGEITPEKSNEIGRELALKLTKGNNRVDVPHGRVGEALTALGVLAHAPAGFQPPVHPLHILRRDERNLLAAELRLDVVFDIIAVAFQRARPDRAVLVFREPAVQPLAQRHAAVLGQLYVLIAFNALVQLLRQRFLRLRVDVPEDRVAVCLVSHDDAPLPAPIVALSDHPVSGWPPFSHMQDSFLFWLFSNNYHAGDRIATSRVESYQKVIISVCFCRLCGLFDLWSATRFAII